MNRNTCADAHRILLNDGIFYYPATNKNPSGKIRTLYEEYHLLIF